MAPITDAMLEAAQDAFDVAEADRQVALRRYVETRSGVMDLVDPETARARWVVAEAARDYAWSVLVCARQESLHPISA